MKDSVKQKILTALCILIVFIPTYIAIAYFGIKSTEDTGNRYSLEIITHRGEEIEVSQNDTDSLAKVILKMNSKLERAGGIDVNTLPQKYYDIKVLDGGSVSSYRYYFSSNPNNRTLVSDENGSFYSIEFKHTKAFLSKEYAYMFYDSACAPTLSIEGGADIIPNNVKWQYRVADGTYIDSPAINKTTEKREYPMSGRNKLKFSISPDKYSVKVYENGKALDGEFDLETLPYDRLDIASLQFVITAEWTSVEGCRGSAEYSFFSSIGKAPEFTIAANTTIKNPPDNTVLMGEFFTVVGTNISAPQKITFKSEPAIDFTPVFFEEGNYVYSIIPIPNDKNAPLEYTFTFSYSGINQSFEVTALPRTVKSRDYECENINISRNSAAISEYERLLSDIGSKYEKMKYFGSDKLIDYETYYDKNKATIILGYGNERVPDNGDESFVLDGVDYGMGSGTDVRAIAAGKVVYSGSSKLLGSFIVVDHGLGLKTWYCHLQSAISTVGDTVQRGAVIGSSGKTGYTNSNGVYLITTVLNIPVCPYSLQESGIVFTLPNN